METVRPALGGRAGAENQLSRETRDQKIIGAVLIGGKSKRMGKDKILLPLAGKPLIEYPLARLKEIFPTIILLGKKRKALEKYGEIYPDLLPNLGPISGIYTALKILQTPVFICAGDMPFLNPHLIRYQIKVLKNFDAVVPKAGGLYEPLHSIYTPACLPAIEKLLHAGKKRPVEFFQWIQLREISEPEIKRFDPDFLSFFNINTLQDLSRAKELLKAQTRKNADRD